jgi:hypothetical protein
MTDKLEVFKAQVLLRSGERCTMEIADLIFVDGIPSVC